jgi:hypothetical protein
MDVDEAARQIEEVLASNERAMVILHGFSVGDDYEASCIASGVTISPDHVLGFRREGEVMRGTAFLPPEQVPAEYRDRVSPDGVVPIGIEIQLGDVVAVKRFADNP